MRIGTIGSKPFSDKNTKEINSRLIAGIELFIETVLLNSLPYLYVAVEGDQILEAFTQLEHILINKSNEKNIGILDSVDSLFLAPPVGRECKSYCGGSNLL